MDEKLWVVGRLVYPYEGQWEFMGVFSNQKVAEDFCKNELYFVGPAIKDEGLDDISRPWPGAYYPLEGK